MSTGDRTGEPMLLDPKNPVAAGFAYLFGLVLTVGGAGAAVFCVVSAFTQDMESTGDWILLAGTFLITLLVAVMGYRVFTSYRADRAQTIALDAHGVDAEALVLSAVLLPGRDTDDVLDVHVRVTGSGFEDFEAAQKLTGDGFEGIVEGAVLPARVNPSNLVFSLKRLRTTRAARP